MDRAQAVLSAASIVPKALVSHQSQDSPQAWSEALQSANPAAPAKYNLTKVLVYKPKTAKNAVPVPVVVVAADNAEVNSGALAKKLKLKELRLASEDLLKEFFGLDKDSLTPLAIDASLFPRVQLVLDVSLKSSSEIYGVHAFSKDGTAFLKGSDIAAYLSNFETAEAKITEIDFVELKSQAAAEPKPAVVAKAAAPAKKEPKDDGKIEGAVQIGILYKKEVDFPGWYTDVLLKSEMMDYYNVSGCYILKPWSYSIWESIQEWFNSKIRPMGVENAYFPMFVSSKVLEREKDHIEGFAPEVAWVTRAGNSELEEPIAIRPTSETVMYPYYAKWIKSHRDLPLRLNQWNSVVRWEFKNPQPFLRTREFLWQEGHTAHLTKESADKEVHDILDLYRRVYEELLAVPVIPGVKSEKEKFAGGLYTTTVEGFIPTTGRGIQGATSHSLGQNFSKMFGIVVEDPNAPKDAAKDPNDPNAGKLFVWQNSWGLSTRVIGVMVMVHGDNKGLVLPPRVASVQVVVVPCGLNNKTDHQVIYKGCEELVDILVKAGIRARADVREGYTPGYKFNDWEQKGVPIRLEVGPADLAKKQALSVRRDNGTKAPIPLEGIADSVKSLLETIQSDMFNRAKQAFDERLKVVTKWEDVVPTLDGKNVVVLPWCEAEACEDDIKERSGRSAEPQDEKAPSAGAKSLAIPFDQARFPKLEEGTTCPACGKPAKRWTMFGRSYCEYIF
ncbi:hypothetical protein M422DRAFT_60741 [Sphaerobolus stellatus SS14]|uniref:proline--tRNA ligase n=1 Tax=Sphaerobolus stellatus (strain SS14) TaxID=990650 RepID=A0A0C9VM76_SPHS4|nr:hypothetical protein M422DRAFT_60741 [Sphaerobolus stellatus SS14]